MINNFKNLTGQVALQTINSGSKSEHEAAIFQTTLHGGSHTYELINPNTIDTALWDIECFRPFAGHTCIVTGQVEGGRLYVTVIKSTTDSTLYKRFNNFDRTC
jgi:hypothetical protein